MNTASMDMDLLPLSGLGTGDLDMDFLEDFVPVSDSFLNSYLQQLESNASHQTGGFTAPATASTGSLTGNVGAQLPPLQGDIFATHDSTGEGTGSREALVLSAMPVPNGSAGPPLSHALDPKDLPGGFYAQETTQPHVAGGVPLPHAGSFQGNASGSTDRSGPNSQGSWDKVDGSAIGHHHASDGHDQNAEGTSSSQRKRREGNKRVRTVAQQQQNKLAQQRYREKRKQKNTELENKVEQLMSQLNALQEVQGQAAQLNGENIALREQVTKQQQIIEDLRLEMKSLAMAAEQAPCPGSGGGCKELCEAAESSSDTCKTKEAKLTEFQQRMKATSPEEALKHFGELVNCIQSSLTEKGLPADAFMPGDARYNDPALKTELSRLVGETCLNCMHLFLTRTICPVEKCDTANPDRFRMIPDCESAKKKWTKCLERVRLTPAQEEILLQQRTELLDSLRRVYAERNRLNLMAIGMMLPHPGQVASFDPGSDAKIKCMEVNGALYCMRTEKQLNDVLDSLKLNLKAEQKLLMEINYKFVHKVLEPAQAAVLMVTAYPSNIDVLALANLLAYHRSYGDITLNKHDNATTKLEAPVPAASIAAQ